jgi:hypothetical protein
MDIETGDLPHDIDPSMALNFDNGSKMIDLISKCKYTVSELEFHKLKVNIDPV